MSLAVHPEGRRARVLVVDDSRFAREALRRILSADPGIEVVGTAVDAEDARRRIKALSPDVVTLDVEMPGMDGLAFLERLMRLRPTPVVMVSALTQRGAEASVRALTLGAVDVVGKPDGSEGHGLDQLALEIVAKVKAAARASVRPLADRDPTSPRFLDPEPGPRRRLIAIGASTGGVEALMEVLRGLPEDSPGIAIVQHLQAEFTDSLVRRLDTAGAIRVKVAEAGEPILPGRAVVAPGGRHMEIKRAASGIVQVRLGDGPPVNGHRPSADPLFHSVAAELGADAIGVILSGIGRDGVEGLLRMRQAGAPTIGQDEASATIYGMPRAAFEAGALDVQLASFDIAAGIRRRWLAPGPTLGATPGPTLGTTPGR